MPEYKTVCRSIPVRFVALTDALAATIPAPDTDGCPAPDSRTAPAAARKLRWCRELWVAMLTTCEWKCVEFFCAGYEPSEAPVHLGLSPAAVKRAVASAVLLARAVRRCEPDRKLLDLTARIRKAIPFIRSCECDRSGLTGDLSAVRALVAFAAARFHVRPSVWERVRQLSGWFASGPRATDGLEDLATALEAASEAASRAKFRESFLARPSRVRTLYRLSETDIRAMATELFG
jgi:hypothetical protein